MGVEEIKHPAKFSKGFTKIFADILLKYDCHKILDPFAGTGKIAEIKKYNWQGEIYANEIEKEWYELCAEHCDVSTMQDAEFLEYLPNSFDAIVTSPTYGNRMADHHKAKDASRRITYTHVIGHDLQDGNTGKMAWGELYRTKHKRIYANICKMVKPNGIFVLNVSNHIRNGKEINVCNFHKDCLEQNGFILIEDMVFGKSATSYSKKGNMIYNPQMSEGKPYNQQSGQQRNDNGHVLGSTVRSPIKQVVTKNDGTRYPRSIIKFPLDKDKLHPTQKPVTLLEYLIKTYTNEGAWVLDNCMGSGSTGVACMNTNRNFIGFELNEDYFNIAKERIETIECNPQT